MNLQTLRHLKVLYAQLIAASEMTYTEEKLKYHVEDLDVDGRIILEYTLKK